jgi:hypothetical protein
MDGGAKHIWDRPTFSGSLGGNIWKYSSTMIYLFRRQITVGNLIWSLNFELRRSVTDPIWPWPVLYLKAGCWTRTITLLSSERRWNPSKKVPNLKQMWNVKCALLHPASSYTYIDISRYFMAIGLSYSYSYVWTSMLVNAIPGLKNKNKIRYCALR